jgi:DNA-directed DNA polymerase III PolC
MTHLHVHSNHSLLEGVATPRQLVARAVEYGMKSLALTDTAGLYAAIPYYQAAREAGIKPILGAELSGTVLLARNREGYAELCRILTAYHCEEEAPIPPPCPTRLTHPTCLTHQISTDSLFVLTSDLQFIEILVRRGLKPLVAVTHYGDRPSRARAERLRAFAYQMGLRPVAVNPIYFLDPDQIRIHRVLSAIHRNTTVDGLSPDEMAPAEAWFRSPEEMTRLYADWPDALENTEWVAEQCNVELPLGKPLFPQIELAPGETPFSLLWKQAFDGLKKHYQPLTPKVVQRFQYELDIIHQLGFAAYFLIIWDIVCYARAQGIPIVGRGSAANSLVAYVLGITRVDPFKYDLYFERFLNPSRTDCPDIDLDICWRRRDDVIDYVYKKYGAERVAMICTFNTFQARSAMRETAKTFGLTDEEAGEIVRQLPHYRANDIRTVVKRLPECRHLKIDEEPLKSILEISEAIDGFPRHLSIHSGGVVIAPEPLTRFVPLQRATKGILITQYDMHPIEDLGLIKMDLLGHRSLTVIQETVELIQRNKGLSVDVERLPDPDKLTADLIRNARTIGCFQIESPAMRALLKSVRADNTDMLIKTLSLIRPGPSGSGMKKHFIDRHLGKEEVVYLHPALEKVLGDTYGVMLYQEDILKVANVIAGMNLGEADALRRAMTKKRTAKEMAKSMKLFMEKAKANGVGEREAEAIWGLIANFAEYSYCKAHASTYGEIAYQCTYLKAHFPAEFLASVLSNRGGFYYPAVYLEEARRSGIEIHSADVNRSEFNYTVEGDAIRVGFLEIRNLTQNAVRAILNTRKAEPFQGIADLCRRANLTYADAEVLIQAGACDGLGSSRPEMLWELKTIFQTAGREAALDERLLFPYDRSDAVLPHLPDYSGKKRTDLEWNHYGLLISKHPIEYYVPAMLDRPRVLSEDMPAYAGDTVTMVGWLIAERRVGLKGRGAMKFLTFEDPAGVFEAVLFPKVYQQYGHLLTSHGPYFITGEVQNEDGYNSLIADHVERVGHNKKSPHHSEITPPLHWLFPYLRETALTHAD